MIMNKENAFTTLKNIKLKIFYYIVVLLVWYTCTIIVSVVIDQLYYFRKEKFRTTIYLIIRFSAKDQDSIVEGLVSVFFFL